jgi:hypothetical protein
MEVAPHIRSRFSILVTWGVRPEMQYASAQTREAAEALKKDAIKMGYKDATIVSTEKFLESRRSSARSEADPRSVNR